MAHCESILDHPDRGTVNVLQNIVATVHAIVILYFRTGLHHCPLQLLEVSYLAEAC